MKSRLLLLRRTFQHRAYLTKKRSVMQVNKSIKLKLQDKETTLFKTFDVRLPSVDVKRNAVVFILIWSVMLSWNNASKQFKKTTVIVSLQILAVTLPTMLQSQAVYDGKGPAQTDVAQPRQSTPLQPDHDAVTAPRTCSVRVLAKPWDERRQGSFCLSWERVPSPKA